jgi:quinoprotein dehydrogenase-associated probable ABC transporter substrate-binding protein
VCADPNNMPFSNRQQQGFENKIASLIAQDLGAKLTYLWFPQRRGFIKHTLRAHDCDVVMVVPTGFDMAEPTQPYYKSTYVFVTRRDRGIHVTSLDDTILRHVKIGVHVVGDDYANPPAVQALAQRGIVSNVVGYSIYGDYSKPDPPAELIRAVAKGDVDVAIVWGPFAGYFARHSHVPLTLRPLPASDATNGLPFTFAIAAASRHGDSTTHTMLERELTQRHTDIQQLLHDYGVPLVALPPATQESRS